MRLWLFTIVAVLSLTAAAATAFLWHRSYAVGDSVRVAYFTAYPNYDLVHEWYAESWAGGVSVARHVDHFRQGEGVKVQGCSRRTYANPTYPFFGTRSLIPSRNHLSVWQRAGFEVGNSSDGSPPSVVQGIILPQWFCTLLLLLLPALWLRFGLPKIRRKRRIATGLCSACGYDLRESPGCCPECGLLPPQSQSDRRIINRCCGQVRVGSVFSHPANWTPVEQW